MLDKESITSIIHSQNKTYAQIQLKQSKPQTCNFQREKGSLVREILAFHNERLFQKQRKVGRPTVQSALLNFLVKQQKQPQQPCHYIQTQNDQQQSVSENLYYNDYLSDAKKSSTKNMIKAHQSQNGQSCGVIDFFLKKNNQIRQVLLQVAPVTNAIKGDSKSFNESTMAVSKLQRTSLSPHRKIRKTQSFNRKMPDISEDNNSESLFNLTENESSCSPQNRQKETFKKDQIKKVMIDLNKIKQKPQQNNQNKPQKVYNKLEASLQEVQQYDELFDCSSQKNEDHNQAERETIFNYLKDKLTKQKVNKSQKNLGKDSLCEYSSSNGESLNSFHSLIQKEKRKVHEQLPSSIGMIVDQTIKAVNQNINIHQTKQDDHNISSLFFRNASQPSTVQKLDERSNDKSQLMRNLEDLGEYQISTELFKKPQKIESVQQQPQMKRQKQMTIDLQAICNAQEVQQLFDALVISAEEHDQSSHNPCMPSFKMQPTDKQTRNDEVKRVQIKLDSLQLSQNQQSEVNLDELSNYESDQSSYFHRNHNQKTEQKPKIKTIILKNNSNIRNQKESCEKLFISDLRQDISKLKDKIQASFISDKSDLSLIKSLSNKKMVKISIDLSHPAMNEQNNNELSGLNQLKQYIQSLQKRIQKDAGMQSQQ